MVKNLPAMQETQIWSLGQEDSLEKEMATHSSIFAWRIPWTEGPGGLQSRGSQSVGHYWVTNTFTFMQDMGFWEMLTKLHVLWKPHWKAIKGDMKPGEPDQ